MQTFTVEQVGTIFSDWDVIQLVRKIHDREQDFYEGNITENIEFWEKYILQEVEVKDLENPYHYELDEYNIHEYKQMDLKTMPPIVLGYFDDNESYLTIDGNHRVAVLQALGVEKVLAFVAVKNEC